MNTETPLFKFALREDIKDEDVFYPKMASDFSTGYDVRAAFHNKSELILRAGQYFKIPLGFRYIPEKNWYFQLHPRSSSFTKKYMHNLIGIIDEDWEGESLFAGQYLPDLGSLANDIVIKYGEAVAQIIPVQKHIVKVEKVSNKEIDNLYGRRGYNRKCGGFGSTG